MFMYIAHSYVGLYPEDSIAITKFFTKLEDAMEYKRKEEEESLGDIFVDIYEATQIA